MERGDRTTARRVLLATIGSAGDVHPLLGLGRALRRRGHPVTLLATAVFETPARRLGLDFLPLGTRADYERGIRDPDLWHPIRGFRVIAERAILPAIRPIYEAVVAHDPATTTVVASVLCVGARIAQEHRGFPLVTHHLQPSLLWSLEQPPVLAGPRLDWLPRPLLALLHRLLVDRIVDPLLAPPVNAVRADLGLPPVRDLLFGWGNSPQGVVGLFPAWFAPPQLDWPPQVHLTGFPLFDPEPEDVKSDPLAELGAGPAPLVATPGSAMVHGRAFFAAVIEASQRLGRPAILLTRHPEQLPRPLSPGIVHRAYIPLRTVLPQAAALIHHGGIGSAAQALAAGIPHLVMPMSHDQPDNAARLRRLGVGAALSPGQFTGRRAAAAVERLLGSAAVAERCRALAARCDGEAALADTSRLIETVGAAGYATSRSGATRSGGVSEAVREESR